jgi:hypothetical protein
LSASLAACGTMNSSTGSPAEASFNGVPYFIGGRAVWVDTEYRDRYACASKAPLRCRCDSSRWGSCLCRC